MLGKGISETFPNSISSLPKGFTIPKTYTPRVIPLFPDEMSNLLQSKVVPTLINKQINSE